MHFLGFIIEPGGWISLVAPWQANGKATTFLLGKSWKIAMNVVRDIYYSASRRMTHLRKIIGACLGLRYLHLKGMVHGDLRGVRSRIMFHSFDVSDRNLGQHT